MSGFLDLEALEINETGFEASDAWMIRKTAAVATFLARYSVDIALDMETNNVIIGLGYKNLSSEKIINSVCQNCIEPILPEDYNIVKIGYCYIEVPYNNATKNDIEQKIYEVTLGIITKDANFEFLSTKRKFNEVAREVADQTMFIAQQRSEEQEAIQQVNLQEMNLENVYENRLARAENEDQIEEAVQGEQSVQRERS